MTREQQIWKVQKLLAPPPAQRDECKLEIHRALDRVENHALFARSVQAMRSKKKSGLQRYYASLQRLLIAADALDPAIKGWFSLSHPTSNARVTIETEVKKAKVYLDKPSAPPLRDASRNKAAVAVAHDLLVFWHHRPTVTRHGKWEQLAKVLSGDLSVDLFDHLRNFKRNSRSSAKKTEFANGIILYRSRGRQPGIKSARIMSDS
jgi:hypothetical protein